MTLMSTMSSQHSVMTSAGHTDRLPSISARHTLVTATGGGRDTDTSDVPPPATLAASAAVTDEEGGGGGVHNGGDRRTLLGVGTYLIDTPMDQALVLRQRFLTYHEQHRGLAKAQNEMLPDIPFRLNPKPESSLTSSVVDNKPIPPIMVDMATSPVFPYEEDLNLSPLGTELPDPSCVYGTTFLRDPEMTVLSVKDLADGVASLNLKETRTNDATMTSQQPKNVEAEEVTSSNVKDITPNVKIVKRVLKEKPRPTIVEPIARSVSFSERPQRRTHPKRFRDLTSLHLLRSNTGTSVGRRQEVPARTLVRDPLPPPPNTDRPDSRQDSFRKRTCSSISDLTEIGSIFSWHDKEFERRTARSVDVDSDSIGPTSFFQMKKSQSLLDFLKSSRKDDPDCKASDVNAFCQKQRLGHLSFRNKNTYRRNNSLESKEADKAWRDIVNTQVIDDMDYEKFASRRKPVTPSTKKRPQITSPKTTRELKYSQADNGKLYPMFVNVGAQAKKFGRALNHNRKLLKSK